LKNLCYDARSEKNIKITYSSITPSKSPVILHDNLQRDYHKPYGPPTSVIWLHQQSTNTNTGTSTASTTGTHWYTRTLLQICDISYACQRYLRLKLETFWNYSCYKVNHFKFFL